jgi:hypothetical protein
MTSLWKDEQGNYSTFRALLWVVTGAALGWVFSHAVEPTLALTYFQTLQLALVGGAGGPRLMQYLAPQLAAAARALRRAPARDDVNGWQPTSE